MRVATLITAAGSGSRFGGLKQFEPLTPHHRLVDEALAVARTVAEWAVVVVPAGHAWDGPAVDAVAPGGPDRLSSIAAGLALLPPWAEAVLIHSASHPLATPDLARAAVSALADHLADPGTTDSGARRFGAGGGGASGGGERVPADGAVPVAPLVDVLKRVDGTDGPGPATMSTVGRAGLGLAQSPMAFRREALEAALAQRAADPGFFDGVVEESEAVERIGGRVVAVAGQATNVHVVDADTLALARSIAANRTVV